MKGGKWIAFDIGTQTLKVAILDKDDKLLVKMYDNESGDNIYYSDSTGPSEVHTSFIKRFIKLYEAENVVFVIQSSWEKISPFTSILYNTAREVTIGKIYFVESSFSVVALYQFLTDVTLNENVVVVDFGRYYMAFLNCLVNSSEMKKSTYTWWYDYGTRLLDKKFSSYIKHKFDSQNLSVVDAACARETLSQTFTTDISLENGLIGTVNRDEFTKIFNESIKIETLYKDSNWRVETRRFFFIGGGSAIPIFTENFISFLRSRDINDFRIVRGLKTLKGNYHCQTAAIVGALYLVNGKCDKFTNINQGKLLYTKCKNKYCFSLVPINNTTCPHCNIDITAKYFLRCRNCGTIVDKVFMSSPNNFCCKCGKHKMELIQTLKK